MQNKCNTWLVNISNLIFKLFCLILSERWLNKLSSEFSLCIVISELCNQHGQIREGGHSVSFCKSQRCLAPWGIGAVRSFLKRSEYYSQPNPTLLWWRHNSTIATLPLIMYPCFNINLHCRTIICHAGAFRNSALYIFWMCWCTCSISALFYALLYLHTFSIFSTCSVFTPALSESFYGFIPALSSHLIHLRPFLTSHLLNPHYGSIYTPALKHCCDVIPAPSQYLHYVHICPLPITAPS